MCRRSRRHGPLIPAGIQNARSPDFRVLGGTAMSFNGDGTVGILDLLILLANWGPCA